MKRFIIFASVCLVLGSAVHFLAFADGYQRLANVIGATVQAWDADLDTLAGGAGAVLPAYDANAATNLNLTAHAGAIQTTAALSGLVDVTLDTVAATNLIVADCLGKVRINGDDDVIDYTLPAAQAGLVVSFANHLYARVITVDSGAGDIIILNNGTALTAADAADSSGAIDDKGTFVAVDGTYWILFSEQNVWVDGGVD